MSRLESRNFKVSSRLGLEAMMFHLGLEAMMFHLGLEAMSGLGLGRFGPRSSSAIKLTSEDCMLATHQPSLACFGEGTLCHAPSFTLPFSKKKRCCVITEICQTHLIDFTVYGSTF